MLIATSRKLQALGILIAETRVTESAAGVRTEAIRTIISQIVPIGGTVALGIYMLILSSSLLPTLRIMIVVSVALGLVAWLLRRSFIRVYSKAQIALQDTFDTPAADPHHPPHAPLPGILREAALEPVTLADNSWAVGKFIRELALRTTSGASIVAIERSGANVINPGPDEELKAHDQLLLLGTKDQLKQARDLLASVAAPA
jgi:CPA2 family monovalent cation:H+ antiporter-2